MHFKLANSFYKSDGLKCRIRNTEYVFPTDGNRRRKEYRKYS